MQQSADNINSPNNLRISNNTIIFDGNRLNTYASSRVKFLVKLNSDEESISDNEISVRWSSASHYGDNIVQCFDLGFGVKTGKTRFRYELQHPEYTDTLATGNITGQPLSTESYTQLEFIKVNNWDKTTGLEIHQTTNIDRIKLFEYKTSEYFVDDYPNGCQIAIKPKKNFDKIDIKDISITEVQSG